MNKEEVLNEIKAAQAAHIEWVHKAKILINGKGSKETSIPVSPHDCSFGKWFYHEGQRLNALSNNPLTCMQNIDRLHSKIHEIYMGIFNTYFSSEQKSGLISKIFGEKKKLLSSDEIETVNEQFKVLESASHELLDELSRLARRLEAVSDEKIENLA